MYNAGEFILIRSTHFPINLTNNFSDKEISFIIDKNQRDFNILNRKIEFIKTEIYNLVPVVNQKNRKQLIKFNRKLGKWQDNKFKSDFIESENLEINFSFSEELQNYKDSSLYLEEYLDNHIYNNLKVFTEILKDNKLFFEATYLSSPSLINDFKEYTKKKSRRKAIQFSETLNKYLIRGTFNPTPMGLWAGITTANWGEENKRIEIDRKYLKRKITISPQALNNIADEKLYFINSTLNLFENKLSWWHRKDKQLIYRSATIPKKQMDLLNSLKNRLLNAREVEIFDQKFYDYGIIQTYNTCTKEVKDNIEDVIFKTEKTLNLNNGPNSIELYEDIKNLVEKRYGYHIDSRLPWKETIINNEVKVSLENSIKHYMQLIGIYKSRENKFFQLMIKKLKDNNQIPLVEAAKLINSKKNDLNPFYWNSYINPKNENMMKEFESLLEDSGERKNLHLNISKLTSESENYIDYNELPKSIDVLFTYNDRNEIYLETVNSNVGRTTWRFNHLLNRNESRSLNSEITKRFNEKFLYVEVDYHQDSFADSTIFPFPNLANKLSIYRPIKSTEDNKVINIGDLYIKLSSENNLILTYGKNGPEVVPCFFSPLSVGNDRLLQLLYNFNNSWYDQKVPSRFSIELKGDGIFHTPRIQVEKWIISLERWTVPRNELTLPDNLFFSADIFREVYNLKLKLGLPRFIVVYTDLTIKSLIVDLENLTLIYTFAKFIKDCKTIIIEEFFPNPSETALKDFDNNCYINKCTTTLHLM